MPRAGKLDGTVGQNSSTEQFQISALQPWENKGGKNEKGAGEIEEKQYLLWGSVHVLGKLAG